jgi:hypothetical protein
MKSFGQVKFLVHGSGNLVTEFNKEFRSYRQLNATKRKITVPYRCN